MKRGRNRTKRWKEPSNTAAESSLEGWSGSRYTKPWSCSINNPTENLDLKYMLFTRAMF